jgi:choline-sulfatase
MTRPNILVLMVDQLNGTLFPDGPADFLHAPHLKALAPARALPQRYTASPLCAPCPRLLHVRAIASRTRVYDNAAEFASDDPDLRPPSARAGYQTCLSGKMHFVGPDQLHGFEERLTTDIYPADFGWTPDYRKPGERIDWWYHNLGSVTGAGVAEITNQMEYDDEVAHHAAQKLYDLSRGRDDRPWCLTVSFTHPHDPYVARKQYLGSLRRLRGARSRDRRADPLRPAGSAFAAASTPGERLCVSDHARGCAPLAARLFRQHLLHRRQDRRTPRCSNAPAWPTTPSSCSSPTMATCWASAACGSR